jgi:hypothetical protein
VDDWLLIAIFYRWSPGKNAINTVHVLDVAGAAWASANWMAQEGRKSANQIAGKPLPFHNDKSKIKEVDGVISPSEKPVAPLFNLVINICLSLDIYYSLTLLCRWMTPRVLCSALARPFLLILEPLWSFSLL